MKYNKFIIGAISNTNFEEELIAEDLEKFGIEHCFDFIICSSFLGIRKYHPDIYYHALKMSGLNPDEAIFVGDNLKNDVDGPQAIDMEAILIDRSGEKKTKDYPCIIIDNLNEIFKFIN